MNNVTLSPEQEVALTNFKNAFNEMNIEDRSKVSTALEMLGKELSNDFELGSVIRKFI